MNGHAGCLRGLFLVGFFQGNVMASVSSDQNGVYVATTYGETCVDGLRRLGAKWNRDTKVWVLPVDALAKVEMCERCRFDEYDD